MPRISTPEPPLLEPRAAWRRALDGLPLRARARFAREEFAADPPPIFQFLLDQFADSGPPPAVWKAGLIENCLLRPGILEDSEAAATLRLALRANEGFDLQLVTAVLDRPGRRWPDDVPEFEMARALDILGAAVKNWQRIRLPLLRFLRVPYPFVRSRMASLSARLRPNDTWFDSLVHDPDPRVRANLIEAMASDEKLSPVRREICQAAARDPHHRLRTTALFVLTFLGLQDGRPELETLQRLGSPIEQRAASWALKRLELTDRAQPHSVKW